MHWSSKYIGLPYHKYNCADLVKYVYKKELDKNLMFNFEIPNDLDGMSKTIDEQFYTFVEKEKLKKPEEFSIALMSGTRQLSHVGVTTKINGRWYVLHAVQNQKMTVRNRVHGIEFTGLRIEGFYRCLL